MELFEHYGTLDRHPAQKDELEQRGNGCTHAL